METFPAPLSESYGECIQAFRAFLLALREEDCRVIHLEQIHLPDILEQYGRAKIWGNQAKADLPARARGSLDDTLRHDGELKKLVDGIFTRLRVLLRQATSIAEKKYDPEAGSDYDSVSSVSAESDPDSDDDADARRSMPKIRLLIQQIIDQIRSLYDLSSLLRRPTIADKYIRSVNSKLDTLTPGDPDTLPLSVGFRISDENHVVEKVLQWRGLTKAEQNILFEEEESVDATRESLITDGVDNILWFCQRLARANTRRREQLQYWNTHPYDPKKESPSATQLSLQDSMRASMKQVEEAQALRSKASTLKPPVPNLPRPGPGSAVSKQSFSTAAVSLVHDTKTNSRPKTVYAPTALGKGRSTSVPDPPKAKDESGTFSCPYCGMTLEYSEMQNKQSWQRHVFRDLRPYICTFKECHNAGKLYVSRHDWIHHELQVHRREYVCKECDTRCQTRQKASAHIKEYHGKAITSDWLNVILDLSERQVDVLLDEKKESCLICGEELSLMALQGHVASHMEDISLFVLPNTEEDDETGDTNASVRVANLESEGKASEIGSDFGSIDFLAVGHHEQSPLDFAKILRDKEVDYADKFSYWDTEHDTKEPAADMAGSSGKAEEAEEAAPPPEEDFSRQTSNFLQQYTLLQKLGKGHFAEVYMGVEKATGQQYAVKIFTKDPGLENKSKTEDWHLEIRVLMGLSHPNVLRLRDMFNERDRVYLVLELAPAGGLFNYIVMKQKLSEDETRKLFTQLFQGTKYLHDRNIVHRDIKPENILLTDKNLHVKLADFGLAKIIGEESFAMNLNGNPSYVAPEMLAESKQRRYTKAVDVWSLGVVLYLCLCGFPPFSDELYSRDFPYTLSEQIRSGRFDYPSPYWDFVGDPALDLIDSMLVVDPERKFTVDQCLSHPWLIQGSKNVNSGTEGVVAGIAGLEVNRRAPVRERTTLSKLYSV